MKLDINFISEKSNNGDEEKAMNLFIDVMNEITFDYFIERLARHDIRMNYMHHLESGAVNFYLR